MNKAYKLPNELKINRAVAERLKTTLDLILEHKQRYGTWNISNDDVEAIQAFIQLMNDKQDRTINYLKAKAEKEASPEDVT